ncbi:MAG: hypothetical protein V4578_00545 [Pseudomonadota bacterium]
MMRTSTLWQVLLLALCAHVGAAGAQTPAASNPPKLEKIEEVADDPITVNAKPAAEKKITEKREGGRVTEAKVKSGKSTYTVKPNNPVGSALPGDALGSANRGPQWTVMEFDIGKKKKKTPEEEAADTSVPPPPPPAKQ